MKKINTIFFGTHEFAVTILKGLIESPFISVDAVVTQPDKQVGRNKKLKASPVKVFAESQKIKLLQPESLKNFELVGEFDIGIVAQYGKLIPNKILESPKNGILNVHTSLLPKYRGASPIQSAIINGETETGVTIMKMDKGLDTGDIILQEKAPIGKDDTYPELDKKLADVAFKILPDAISKYVDGDLVPKKQNNSETTECRQFSREDGLVDWNKTSDKIYNMYRGLTPWPGIFTTWNGKRLKLLEIKTAEEKISPGAVEVNNGKIYIGCDSKSIEIISLQLEGKKPMDAKSFLNGFKNFKEARLQ